MRIQWDATKRQEVLRRRQIDVALLDELLRLPYVENQRRDGPEQYRVIAPYPGAARDGDCRVSP